MKRLFESDVHYAQRQGSTPTAASPTPHVADLPTPEPVTVPMSPTPVSIEESPADVPPTRTRTLAIPGFPEIEAPNDGSTLESFISDKLAPAGIDPALWFDALSDDTALQAWDSDLKSLMTTWRLDFTKPSPADPADAGIPDDDAETQKDQSP